MPDKPLTIHNGPVTLYVCPDYSSESFVFKGLTVEGDGTLYMENINEYHWNHFDVGGRPCIDLCDYLQDVYQAMADAELAAYLEKHICDRKFYCCESRDVTQVWYCAGQSPQYRHQTRLVLERVADGIVGYEVDHTVCLYDLVNKKHVGFKNVGRNAPVPTTPMRVFYGLYLEQLLALEQHKRGTAPPAYAELVRLAAFLEGKKSVKLVMKDGSIHELKPRNGCDVSLSRLLSIVPADEKNPFTLHDDYDMKPRFERGRHLTDLDYLQYGRHRFTLDTNALQSAT